ncbi:YhdP family protein [Billgrantia gudaonensis]|uniref:TIGR02099 family protein n=1 Tax=Billgrantia gudaonensis TaxID=376427 RepID=A0A1G8XMJ1_9GAMM|nr:YhdP family protein [Halomonas gudaonensis]SDJ91809.1 TIGR02099 family protein [Halomonas gudaonensis]
MHPIRWLSRWVLTLVAAVLGTLAVLLLLLRLALTQVDDLAPRVERLIEASFGAWAELEHLDAQLVGLDPRVEAGGLVIRSRQGGEGLALLEVEGARLRLDTPSSLRDGVPVVEEARLDGVTLHLYQNEQGAWHWPEPARVPAALIPDAAFDLQRLDFWVGLLLRQRAWVEDLRVVLHGREAQLGLTAPRLLMTGDARRTHLEGEVFVDGDPEASLQAALEIFPGPGGFGDFSAALQADMKLDTLIELAAVFTRTEDPLRLAESRGEARLWGRWHRGTLADARLDLTAPRLALRHDAELIALENVEARGQWLRDEAGNGWQAWLEGDAGTVDWAAPEEMARSGGPALPHRWHLRRTDDGWWLNTSEFELASLAAWRDRVPLPVGLTRTIDSLAPRGRVDGLGVGRRNGEWLARAALHDVEVSPWEQAPGGGPLDAWVDVRDLTGSVRFVGADGMTLDFPEIFPGPLALAHASGEVNWAYDGPRSFVSGRGLRVGWQGAEIEGGFGLAIGGEERGGLGLDLDFRGADARQRPLADWLPTKVLDPELTEWLAGGAAGLVPQGRVRLHVPIGGEETQLDPQVRLDLTVEEGRLPFAPQWPALEAVNGQLEVDGEELEAVVHHAESLGVTAANGRVTLRDDDLRVRGDLVADGESLRRYLLAMPVEGTEAVSAWHGEGVNEAGLDLALTLDEPESLDLSIDTHAAFTRLSQDELGLTFHDVQGPLVWHQRGEAGGLSGEIEARLLGGPLTAQFDTLNGGGITLNGTASVPALLDWGGANALDGRLSGRVPWQGDLELSEGRNRLRLTSDLDGLAIDLPAPFGKTADASRALRVDADLDGGRIDASLGDIAALRWRPRGAAAVGQGQLWIGRVPTEPPWPDAAGWHVDAYQPRLQLPAWRDVVSPAAGSSNGGFGDWLRVARLETDCLDVGRGCVGSLAAEAVPQAGSGWRVDLDGSLMEGRFDYRPAQDDTLELALDRLTLDDLMPADDRGRTGELLNELDVAPDPVALSSWVSDLPNGRVRIADIEHRDRTFGPFTARWRAQPERLTVTPLALTLGEVTAQGEVVWEAAGEGASLTRSRVDLEGGDLGTALERLGQPVTLRNATTRVRSQLAWSGAPWQFALARSRGSVEVELREGRFLNVESPSARLVGLFNLDNLVRRLRLDFSDVTGQGTAFDSVVGAATLYEGILETRGPVEVKAPATTFTLEGTVDLARRELDQRLGVTVPISRNLPLAAVIAGAPVVGGALFIADQLFGSAIDRVTRIHYRVRGPWTAPQITLEDAE